VRVYSTDHHVVPLPVGHRFPMGKYALLREMLLERRVLDARELLPVEPAGLARAALLAVHDAGYVERFLDGTLDDRALRRIGFPWSPALVRRTLASAAGTLAAARAALADGIAGNLAGGTHHAFADHGSGYCIFNDIAIAARALLDEGSAARVLVVDLDVHQGDGTAAIFGDEPRVFTFSMHGARNFPFTKQKSDLDVELADGTGDVEYLETLRGALAAAVDRARPGFIFYQAGVDPLAEDRLGKLALSHAGLRARDRHVLETARRLGVPTVLTLGGGYAQPLAPTIEAHVGTYATAKEVFT
jgi:acetoin utilization deacetylase AcuC-like enzyme